MFNTKCDIAWYIGSGKITILINFYMFLAMIKFRIRVHENVGTDLFRSV